MLKKTEQNTSLLIIERQLEVFYFLFFNFINVLNYTLLMIHFVCCILEIKLKMAAAISLLPVRIVSLFACNEINLTILALSMQQILNVCFFFFFCNPKP